MLTGSPGDTQSNVSKLVEALAAGTCRETCKTLVLSTAVATSIPDSASQMVALVMLDLSNCTRLIGLPKSFSELPILLEQLEWLDLSNCSSLIALSKGLCELPLLKQLDVQGCTSLVDLPECIRHSTELVINLEVPAQMLIEPKTNGVVEFNLLGSEIRDTEDHVRAMLTSLSEVGCDLCKGLLLRTAMTSKLPSIFNRFTALQKLDLRGCSSLVALPDCVAQLPLTVLDITGCYSLVTLPSSNGGWLLGWHALNVTTRCANCVYNKKDQLAELNFSDFNCLVDLPEFLTGRTVMANRERRFRECVTTDAIEKNLEMEQLFDFSEMEMDSTWCAVNILSLTNCSSLVTLPESICQLAYLEILKLAGCKALLKLPESVGNLKALKTLNLSHCSNLESLPESAGELTALEELDMTSCVHLTLFPEGLGRLSDLKKGSNFQLKFGGCPASNAHTLCPGFFSPTTCWLGSGWGELDETDRGTPMYTGAFHAAQGRCAYLGDWTPLPPPLVTLW